MSCLDLALISNNPFGRVVFVYQLVKGVFVHPHHRFVRPLESGTSIILVWNRNGCRNRAKCFVTKAQGDGQQSIFVPSKQAKDVLLDSKKKSNKTVLRVCLWSPSFFFFAEMKLCWLFLPFSLFVCSLWKGDVSSEVVSTTTTTAATTALTTTTGTAAAATSEEKPWNNRFRGLNTGCYVSRLS